MIYAAGVPPNMSEAIILHLWMTVGEESPAQAGAVVNPSKMCAHATEDVCTSLGVP